MIEVEKEDRRLARLFHDGTSNNIAVRQFNIKAFWKDIKDDIYYLDKVVMVVKNKWGENTLGGIATAYLLIDHHKQVSPRILSILLKNIFTVCIYKDNTKKIFETEITIIDQRYSYLTYVLITNDLVINDEYQQIIAKHFIKNEWRNFIDDLGFFIRRDDIKEEYKKQVLESMSKETIRRFYDEWYGSVVNTLIEDFNYSFEDATFDPTAYIGKTEHKDEMVNKDIQLNLKLIKYLEDYLFQD